MPARVDVEKCEGCGDCVEACATGSIEMVDDKARVNEDECCECVACVDECKQQAIAIV